MCFDHKCILLKAFPASTDMIIWFLSFLLKWFALSNALRKLHSLFLLGSHGGRYIAVTKKCLLTSGIDTVDLGEKRYYGAKCA